jgi:glycosyltransferase involved in cell wall biosynthesis
LYRPTRLDRTVESATGPVSVRIEPVNHKISVVIPTYRQGFLDSCLEGLAEQSNPAFEVIVVENGPATDGTRALVDKYKAHLRVRYHHDARAGLNRARNTGVTLARFDLIALLDDDCRPAPDWADGLLEAHANQPDAGTIGGKVCLDFAAIPPG